MMGEMGFTATGRVLFGRPAAEAIADIAQSRDARRVFILAVGHLRRDTDEIAKIEAGLRDRHAATGDGIRPHAPRGDVLAATEAARAANCDLIVAVGGGAATASEAADRLIRGLGMPRTLAEVGVADDRFQQIADYTMLDIWGRTHPRPVNGPDDILQILRMAA